MRLFIVVKGNHLACFPNCQPLMSQRTEEAELIAPWKAIKALYCFAIYFLKLVLISLNQGFSKIRYSECNFVVNLRLEVS